MTRLENLPEELKALPRWVCAKAGCKAPLTWQGGPASTTNPSTWAPFEWCAQALEEGLCDQLGFVFAGDGLVGIDVDHCVDEWGCLSDEALEAVEACGSYAEVSRSGAGLHVVVRAELPWKGRANGRGWEAYASGRYFILTGASVGTGRVAEAQAAVDRILARHFADVPREGSGGRGPRQWEAGWSVRRDGRVDVLPRPEPVSSGGRHLAMVSLAGRLWQAGLSKEAVGSYCEALNVRCMKPPLGAQELAGVVESVARYRR